MIYGISNYTARLLSRCPFHEKHSFVSKKNERHLVSCLFNCQEINLNSILNKLFFRYIRKHSKDDFIL